MHRLTNKMCRRRWSAVNQVSSQAMKSVQIIKVVIRSASAKTRATNINGLEKAGLGDRDDVWTGVIPLYEVLGDAVESEYTPGRPIQNQISSWIQKRNADEKSYAERVAQVPLEELANIRNVNRTAKK
jgi:hypothetical protein